MSLGDKNSFNETVTKIITQYKLADSIKEGKFNDKTFQDKAFTEDEFKSFITGKNIKNLIFQNNNIADKRFSTEEYYKLYELMGGDTRGISKTSLRRCLLEAYQSLNGPEEYLNNQPVKVDEKKIDQQVNEILEYLSDKKDNQLTIEDFVNAMTCNKSFPTEEEEDNILN